MISQNDNQEISQYTEISPLNEKHGVFLVRDEVEGRMCVKKILKTYNADIYERLKTAKIKGLPEIYQMEENDGELTLIEEYISGETIDSMLKNRGALPENEVRDIAVKLCDILSDLHSLNPPVIHRDIKPSNVMVTLTGEVRLLDLNAPPVEKRTSDQVMGKEEEYFVPDYASMTSDAGGSEEVNEGEELLSNLNENEERRRSTPIDIKAKENSVLLDEDDIKIIYKRLDADFLGHAIRLKLLIENNSSEPKTIQIRDESINGYMCEGIFSSQINAGMKANDEITFSELSDEVGITSKEGIKNIVFAFCDFDMDGITGTKIYNPINLQF